MDIDEISGLFERIAPRSLAESWDNSGWQVRMGASQVTGILLALEASPEVLDEAARLGCNLLFTHHPAIFRAVKSIDVSSPVGAVLDRAFRHGISIWSSHTNLDAVPEGTSFALARALGLEEPKILARIEQKEYKLVVYVPETHTEAVKAAMAEAGAGEIGDYSACFWQVLGTGQFRPEGGADPYVGRVGEVERVDEYKLESVVHAARLPGVMEAMRRAHPYEEVAYDLFTLENPLVSPLYGYGAVGRLATPAATRDFARRAASALASTLCVVAGDPERLHERVAVMGGSGSSHIGDALRSGAKLFITADVRYHDAQDAVARGLDLVILDHYSTERPVLEEVRLRLEGMVQGVPLHISTVRTSPYARLEP
jgi:dinuclear metal center YbgI/SA1388 family protein